MFSTKILFVHILHFPGNLYKDAMLIVKCRHSSLLPWSGEWRERFNSMYVETVLMHDKSAQGMQLKKSKVRHLDDGLGLFAYWTIGISEMSVYYYDFPVYANLTKMRHKMKNMKRAYHR